MFHAIAVFSAQKVSSMAQLPPPLLGYRDTAVPWELLCIQHAWPGRENGSKEATAVPRKYLTLIKICVWNMRWSSSFNCVSPASPWWFPSHPNEAGGGIQKEQRYFELNILQTSAHLVIIAGNFSWFWFKRTTVIMPWTETWRAALCSARREDQQILHPTYTLIDPDNPEDLHHRLSFNPKTWYINSIPKYLFIPLGTK